MNNKEVIDITKDFCKGCDVSAYVDDMEKQKYCDTCWVREYNEKILNELEKAEKYKWHDLRKDQDDLPESERVVCVLARMKCYWDGKYRLYPIQMTYSRKIMYGKAVGWGVSYPYDFDFETDEVIAWRETETYEKKEG